MENKQQEPIVPQELTGQPEIARIVLDGCEVMMGSCKIKADKLLELCTKTYMDFIDFKNGNKKEQKDYLG